MFKRRKTEKFVIRPGRSRAGRTLVLVGSRLFVSERLVEATTWAEKHKAVRKQQRRQSIRIPGAVLLFSFTKLDLFKQKTPSGRIRGESRSQERSKLTSHPVLKGSQASESPGEQTHCRTWECVKQFPVSGSCFLCISRLRLDVMMVKTSVQRAESDADLWPSCYSSIAAWPANSTGSTLYAAERLHRLSKPTGQTAGLVMRSSHHDYRITPTTVIHMWYKLNHQRMEEGLDLSFFGESVSFWKTKGCNVVVEALLLQKSSVRGSTQRWIRDGPSTDLVEVSG